MDFMLLKSRYLFTLPDFAANKTIKSIYLRTNRFMSKNNDRLSIYLLAPLYVPAHSGDSAQRRGGDGEWAWGGC